MKRVVTRRLPGFRFEAESPPLAEWLPRMDVACFVGFAASGPLHVPVAVESVEHFEAVFGRDAALAWDRQGGEQARAHLAPAVRAFFGNGGRRCWIVRVARERPTEASPLNRARSNLFPVPALAQAALDERGEITSIVPAFAQARSEGSWSDSLEVAASLLSSPVQVTGLSLASSPPGLPNGATVELLRDAPDDLSAGDLLRLTFDDGLILLLYVAEVTALTANQPGGRRAASASCRDAIWLRPVTPTSSPPEAPGVFTVRVFNSEPQGGAVAGVPAAGQFSAERDARFVAPDELAAGDEDDESVSLQIEMPLADAPRPGSILCADSDAGQLIFVVREAGVGVVAGPGAGEAVKVACDGFRRLREGPTFVGASAIKQAERLSFELRVRKQDEYLLTFSDLAFGAEHGRFWGKLPTDAQVYQTDETAPVNEPTEDLWQPVGVQRFPLAATDTARVLHFPVAMSSLAENFLGAAKPLGSPLERDGLAEFDAALFLDPDLADATTSDLMPRADFLRYLGSAPRPLRGMHAALSVEEVTIISAPDAVQRGWDRPAEGEMLPPARSKPFARPEWWSFLDCRKYDRIPLVHRPLRSQFLPCGVLVIERPALSSDAAVSETGTFTLSWTWQPPAEEYKRVTFFLEESGSPQFTAPSVLYSGSERSYTLYGRSAGDYYYRVRAEITGRGGRGAETSDWSLGAGVRVTAGRGWQARPAEEYDDSVLLAVQRSLLRLCAARADLLAVLSLPEHYREDKSLEHVEALRRTYGEGEGGAEVTEGVAPFGGGELGALSYGALYHPWLTGRDASEVSEFRNTPPDGAACGVLAARALARGAWIAPANEPLRGPVALTPRVARDRWLDLQLAQINLVRQEPRGFLVLNADTLAAEEELRQISVRRLLILLRRLALRHGATYVFEPNSAAFRRLVQRGFESLLDRMFARGAFAGATPATSYQVVTHEGLNTPRSVEQGRFIVELRVAPSQPLTFLTIRLVQTGDRGFVTEVR